MRPIQRVLDTNSAGGVAIAPRPTVLSSGRPLAAFASPVSPHPCCGVPGCEIHCAATIAPTGGTVFAEGTPVHKTGDPDTCGHIRATGDMRVLVGL